MRQLLVAILLASAGPAFADVRSNTPAGFEIVSITTIAADPATVYATLVKPGNWWSSAHSWSGDAANMSLDSRAGGCFCETLPGGGSVEHGRVVMAQPGKLLRLTAALGPLQSEAVTGTLTWTLKPAAGGTEVILGYVVAGYIRAGREAIPAAVDAVLDEQLAGLKRRVEAD